jgi:hypothetical protein
LIVVSEEHKTLPLPPLKEVGYFAVLDAVILCSTYLVSKTTSESNTDFFGPSSSMLSGCIFLYQLLIEAVTIDEGEHSGRLYGGDFTASVGVKPSVGGINSFTVNHLALPLAQYFETWKFVWVLRLLYLRQPESLVCSALRDCRGVFDLPHE